MSARVEDCGTTCTRAPRSASCCGVRDLMPRSTATTVATTAVPSGGSTVYTSLVVTSRARSAPAMNGDWRTTSRRTSRAWAWPSSAPAGSAAPEKMPPRMTPRSRRCRVRARVSTSQIPTTDCSTSSSSNSRRERQLEARRAGSRTTYPATQMRWDSGSSSFIPVLPTWGAVMTTICRW